MKRKITAISLVVVCLCALMCLTACGANVGVETVRADDNKEIEVVANDKTMITVQELTYDGWRITETVKSVKWTESGALVIITYENGNYIVSSANNYIVKVHINDN